MSVWQDIIKAPRDGTPILAWVDFRDGSRCEPHVVAWVDRPNFPWATIFDGNDPPCGFKVEHVVAWIAFDAFGSSFAEARQRWFDRAPSPTSGASHG